MNSNMSVSTEFCLTQWAREVHIALILSFTPLLLGLSPWWILRRYHDTVDNCEPRLP